MAISFDWNQFKPYEDGGITGRTYTLDPSVPPVADRGYGGAPGPNNPEYAGIYNPDGTPIAKSGFTTPSTIPPAIAGNGGIMFDPGQNTPSNPYYNNTGVAGGGSLQQMGGSPDALSYFSSKYPAGSNLSPDMLLADEADLKAHGITLIKNAAGRPGKIQLADGSAYDVIEGAGAGTNRAQLNKIADAGGVPVGGGAPGYGSLNGLGAGYMTTPMSEFTPPTAEDALNSPGLQFALEEANRMGQNSAAAKGTLLNGRVQQALYASNIQNALQGFGDVYNRAANTFGINYGVKTGNQDRPFSKYLSLAQLGQGAASQS